MSCIKHIKKKARKKADYTFSREEAEIIARELCLDFAKEKFDFEEFYMGVNVELEHGLRNKRTNVTDNDPILTAKIAIAHLYELPDYYKRLKVLEKEGNEYWKDNCY